MSDEFNKEIGIDNVKVMQVIVCTKKRRGKGVTDDPIRMITEIFTLDGDLIAEHDPQNEISD